MTIEAAEQLKAQLTDRWVVVDQDVPELRRFAKLVGQVKTVNMNGRALVQFAQTADVSWYDIDPAHLTVVPAPDQTAKPEKGKAAVKPAVAAPATPAAATPTVAPSAAAPAPENPTVLVESPTRSNDARDAHAAEPKGTTVPGRPPESL